MMAVALPSSPVTGAASVVAGTLRAFGPHRRLSLNPSTHLNLSFASNSITIRSNFLLKLKTPTLSPHLFYPLNPLTPPYPYKCLAAMAGDESEEQGNEEDEEDIEADENEHEEERRLYVGNLPYSMTQSQLTDVFQEAGRVDAVEVVYDRVTDRSRGFAFVTMGSAEEAKEAIRMLDGSQIGGRTAKVNFPEIPRGGEREVMAPRIRRSFRGFIDSPYKVYVGNLGWSLTSEALKEAFQDQPGLLGAKVIYERDSGRSRGFGFVSFASAEDVESALNAMNGVEVQGRPLRLNLASQRERTTAATSSESPQMQEAVIEPVSNAMQSSLGY
eukprot:TRINITY_DN4114_c0_g1_i1.p1 TRINITY_DN4114_c0_g1~~TRINITY_DN4114_c0_g1_i1.p1  ORF type:complete len:329 (+),score=78.34 TRINITY_DN4114_c0_g1_i1:238-1224(+)